MCFTPTKESCDTVQKVTDISEIRGNQHAKRALLVAAAGGHNILLSGSPGSGKTMLARSMPGILDPMSPKQAMEVTAIESIAREGFCKEKWQTRRFRAPHHNCSVASITGGGRIPVPGEISLAHRGVLFLDELPEFPRAVLESLRQPLEDGHLTISRAEWKVNFPADFQLVAAMNPCPCGYYSSEDRECHCSKPKIMHYLGRLSGPLLDRIDIQVMVNNPRVSLLDKPQKNKENSESFRNKIISCRKIQMHRQNTLNNRLSAKSLLKLSLLDRSSSKIFNKAIKHYQLSIRAQQKILRVARTIADLAHQNEIPVTAITEAVSYRAFDQLLKKARNFL